MGHGFKYGRTMDKIGTCYMLIKTSTCFLVIKHGHGSKAMFDWHVLLYGKWHVNPTINHPQYMTINEW